MPHDNGTIRRLAARLLGVLGLLGVVIGCLVVVAVVARPPGSLSPPSRLGFYPGWLSGPLRDAWPFAGTPTTLRRVFDYGICGMYIAYLLALVGAPRLHRRWTLGAILAVHLILLVAPPLPLTDVFNYVNYGRMQALHGLNPYVTIPALEPHADPAFALSNWHHLLSPYGPLFTIYTLALVPLGVTTSFWVFKAVLMLASLGTLFLVWRCAELLHRDPLRAVLLVGLNPPVLVWGLGGDHNDFLMVVLLMLAVYLTLSSRATRSGPLHFAAGVALVAACAVKLPAAALAPILLVVVPRRAHLLAGMATALVAIGLASFAAFGPHLPDLGVQSTLVTSVGLPNLLGAWLGLGGETAGLRAALVVVLLVTVALCVLWARRRHGDWLVPAGAAVLALVLTLSWQAPWYVLWLLPFAALARHWHLRAATLLLGVYVVLAYGSLVNLRPPGTALQQTEVRQVQRLVH